MTGRPSPPIAWGVTTAEIEAAYPCSELVTPAFPMWRGISVAAPASVTFAWVEQLRVAPYAYDLVDNLGRRSPRTRSETLGPAVPGERFVKVFEIVDVVPSREITARATPRSRQAMGDSAVTYRVRAVDDRTSRIVVRMDVASTGALGAWARRLLPRGDLVMMRRQLRTLAARAESEALTAVPDR